MKKFTSFIVTAALTTGIVSAYAADKNTVTMYESGNIVYTEQNNGGAEYAVVSAYDGTKLVYSTHSLYDNGKYIFNVPEEYRNDKLRICYIGNGTYDVKIEAKSETTATPAPSQTANAEVTVAPTDTPSQTAVPEATKTPYPSIYPKAMDAVNAFAVVEDVEQTVKDGEIYYSTTMLYQGTELVHNIREWVTIASAPDSNSSLIGQNAGALKSGDIVHFTTDLQRRIKSIEFIYRPTNEDYILNGGDFGDNFQNLISSSGKVANQAGWSVAKYGSKLSGANVYAFGAVFKQGRNILLANSKGKTIYLPVENGTIVYTVNINNRSDKCEFVGNGSGVILTNYLSKNNLGDDDTVLSWEDNDELIYALARIIEDTVTDIVIFQR